MTGIFLRALYEYSAVAEEEISFPEGATIKLLRKDDNGIDDGWWEGEYMGKCGVFPSIVVEELGSGNEVCISIILSLLTRMTKMSRDRSVFQEIRNKEQLSGGFGIV